MNKTIFEIPKMDCPSEESLIRMTLEDVSKIKKLDFDLKSRQMSAFHDGDAEEILSLISKLNLGAKIVKSHELEKVEEIILSPEAAAKANLAEMSVLKKVFIINLTMFFVGIISGIIAQSTGLIADSLDMFADAVVFGLAMYAVGRSQLHKKQAARISGYLQMILATWVFTEVIRKFLFGSDPESFIMMAIATTALIANSFCMFLLAKHRKGEVHMQASWIFLSNDVIANLGVIIAGALVSFTDSNLPDLAIGSIIAVVVFSGAIRILRTSK